MSDTTSQKAFITDSLKSYGYDQEDIDRFMAYHLANKWVWQRFKSMALEMIQNGAKRIGAKQICEEIRRREPKDSPGFCLHFKVNNNYPAMYARVFVSLYPLHRFHFELRQPQGFKPMEQTSLELRGKCA